MVTKKTITMITHSETTIYLHVYIFTTVLTQQNDFFIRAIIRSTQ